MKQFSFYLWVWPVLLVLTSEAYSQKGEVTFTILHTNDEHSHLIPHPVSNYHPVIENPSMGGFARLAGMVNRIRNEKAPQQEPVLLFSGGDILGGSAFAWLLLRGLTPELSLMQAIGYDAVVIGNHEFDYGSYLFSDYLKSSGYPEAGNRTAILGTNVNPPPDHPLSDMDIRRTVIKELENGLRVGLLGLLGEDAESKTAFPEPVEFADPLESARQAVQDLKQQGTDVIISVNHSGVYEDRILAREVPGIDVIIGGHSHTALYKPVVEGETIIVQAGSYLNYLGMLELRWDPEMGRVSLLNEERDNPYLIPLDHTVTPDPDVANLIEHYEFRLNKWVEEMTNGHITDIRQTIAASDFTLSAGPAGRETGLGNFITDAMRVIAGEATGKRVDVAVQANGAIRSHITPGVMEWSEGNISFYDMVMATGLGSGDDGNPGYPLVSFYLTENEIRNAMEISHLLYEILGNTYFLQFSGVRMEYDPGRAVLLHIPFSGTPLPTSRTVLHADLYTGSGLQTVNDEWTPIEKGSDRLLHVVTDYYIASFLPMVGEMLPNLTIEFKNEAGDPVELDDTIIQRNGNELKVWQAVTEYTAGMPVNRSGLPGISDYYQETGERLVIVNVLPLWFWPVICLLLLSVFTIYSVQYFRRRSAKQ